MTEPKDEYYIWWLSPLELELLVSEVDRGVTITAYLESELRSALGRNGRGRLWDAHKTGLSVDPWPDHTLGRYCGQCAGIVVSRHDVQTDLEGLPGLLTNFKLERPRDLI